MPVSINPAVMPPMAPPHAPVIPHMHGPQMRTSVAANDARMGVVAAGNAGEKQTPKATPSAADAQAAKLDNRAGWLQSISSKLMLPFTLWTFGDMGKMLRLPGIPGIRNLPRFKTAVGSVVVSLPQAMRETRLSNLFDVGAKHQEHMAAMALQEGGKAVAWGEAATARAASMAQKAAGRNAWMAEKTIGIRGAVGNAVDRVAKTGIGSKFQNWLGRGELRGVVKSAANMNVFVAATLAGVGFVIGAHALRGGAEKTRAHDALDDMIKAAGGDPNNGFIQNVRKAFKGNAHYRLEKTGLDVANELATASFAAMPGAGGLALGAMQMAPMAAGVLLSDNPIANAYMMLKKAEKGEVQLQPEDKLKFTKYLMTAVPELADPARGGIYNGAISPAAQALVEKGLSADETVGLISNPAKFDAFLKETKQASVEATKAATANDNGAGHVNTTPDIAPKSVAEQRYHAADKPGSAVIAGTAAAAGTQAHGRIAANGRHLG